MKKINIKTARANKINHSTEMVFILDRSGSMAGLNPTQSTASTQ